MARCVLAVGIASVLAAGTAGGQALDPKAGTLWSPYVEWSLENPTYGGNAFDLDATVTFTHTASGQARTTKMFYDGGTTWKWRFSGSAPGEWTFTTSSGDADLNGRTGTVTITDAPENRGFVQAQGKHWVRQVGTDGVEAILPNFVMYESDISAFHNNAAAINQAVQTFIQGHGFTGFHVAAIGGQWFDMDHDQRVDTLSKYDPDPRTFEALEQLIVATYAAGGVVHIWPWGDTSRNWTSDSLPGGENGAADQRLQRYIAARLGPLPGWTMGYGFDLNEWTNNANLRAWHDKIQDESGWDHLLSGRSTGPNSGTDHSGDTGWHVGLDYSGYEHHEPTYEVYVAALDATRGGAPVNKPVMSEDRFRVRGVTGPGKDYTYDQTRRGLWLSTMAGGVANIWGNLTKPDGTVISGPASLAYPNADQIKTWSVFFNDHHRFLLDMVRDNALTGGPASRQYALRSDDGNLVVVYGEDTDEIEVNLSLLAADPDWAPGARILAVDTREAYLEIDLGTFALTDQVVALGGTSDWALTIQPVPEPTSAVSLAMGGALIGIRRKRR